MPIDLPPRTICDHNCFLPPGHDGPHGVYPLPQRESQGRHEHTWDPDGAALACRFCDARMNPAEVERILAALQHSDGTDVRSR